MSFVKPLGGLARTTNCLYCCLTVLAAYAQGAALRDDQTLALLSKSLTVLTGGNPVSDVRLEGAVTFFAGSEEESGTAILDARGTESQITLNLESGARTETRNDTKGSWSGPDGLLRFLPLHNAWTSPGWFFPEFIMLQALQDDGFSVGPAPLDAAPAGIHGSGIRIYRVPKDLTGDMTAEIEGLSTMDLELDAGSLLPVSLSFNTHPDDDLNVNLPVRVEFRDYRTVQPTKSHSESGNSFRAYCCWI